MKFYLSAAAGGVGVLVTLLWVPELSSLDLAEGDARWAALRKGARLKSSDQNPMHVGEARLFFGRIFKEQKFERGRHLAMLGTCVLTSVPPGLDCPSEAGCAPMCVSKSPAAQVQVRRPHT